MGQTFFCNNENKKMIEQIINTDNTFSKYFLTENVVDGAVKKRTLSITKDSGDRLFFISQDSHSDVKNYFSFSKLAPQSLKNSVNETRINTIDMKKRKQSNLLNFFKKRK